MLVKCTKELTPSIWKGCKLMKENEKRYTFFKKKRSKHIFPLLFPNHSYDQAHAKSTCLVCRCGDVKSHLEVPKGSQIVAIFDSAIA